MGFFDQLSEGVSKRYPRPVNPADGPQPPGRFSFGTQTYGGPAYTDAFKARRAPTQYQLGENYAALIYAMVNRTRDGVARVPLRLMADGSRVQGKPSRACDAIKVSRSIGRKMATEGKVSSAAVDQVYEIRNHPVLDVLDSPDPYGTFTREKLIGLVCSYMDVFGSGYLVPEGNGWDWTVNTARRKGPPEHLWVIYPQYVIPIRLGASPIVDTFQYFADRLPLQSVMWFRHNYSLKDAYGAAFSPTAAGEPYRQQEQELVAILSQVLGIGPRPNLLVTAKDSAIGIIPSQKQAFEQDLVRRQSGGNAGGVLINDGSWDITPIDYPKADIAAKEIAEHDRNNLASIFGMPPTYFTVDTNLANLQAADVQFAMANTAPRLRTIAAVFTRLVRMFDERMFFAFDPPIPEDDEMREKVFTMRLASGRATINQVNEEEKYPPVEWGDEPWMPGTLVQPSMAMATHELGLETGKKAMESGQQADELAADGHEHQKQMDKEGLKIDAKKASQKPAAKRSLSEAELLVEAQDVLRTIQGHLATLAEVI